MKTPMQKAGGVFVFAIAAVAASTMLGPVAIAGANLDTFTYENVETSPYPGIYTADLGNMRWDDRCVSVKYRMNNTLDPIANGFGVPPLPLAEVAPVIQAAMDSWNDIPTSYIELNLEGTVNNPGLPKYDFINEVNFLRPYTSYTASSRAITLLRTTNLADGDDIDMDGDSDVSAGISTCADVDGDGDIEFPTGVYAAGTILDNDIVFTILHWAVDEQLVLQGAPDLVSAAIHEFGHGHGLAHSAVYETGGTDGTPATMGYPGDYFDQYAQRSLHPDDIAWSSFLYPEGTRDAGPGSLQPGDIAFDERYAVVSGNVSDDEGNPIAGALVFARDYSNRIVSSAVAGKSRLGVDAFGGAYFLPEEILVQDGDYELPVPKGFYRIGVEPNDRFPEATLGSMYLGELAEYFGRQTFTEEYFSGPKESGREVSLGSAAPVFAFESKSGIDLVVEDNVFLESSNPLDFFAQDFWGDIPVGPHGIMLAVRIPVEKVNAVDEGRGIVVQGAQFGTFPWAFSTIAEYPSAMITTGRVAANGPVHIDVKHPLVRAAPFIAQDRDFTPLYAGAKSLGLGAIAKHLLPRQGKDFFVVLEFSPEEDPLFPGFSPFGAFIDRVSEGETTYGMAYYSRDKGKTWTAENPLFNYHFGLLVSPR